MIIAIGDIHGQLGKLHRLMQKLEPLAEDDVLLFIGDYIDRGPDSAGVIDYLYHLGQDRPNTIFLRGNHDQAMMDARDLFDPNHTSDMSYDDIAWWFAYGGRETLASYGSTKHWWEHVPACHWEFLESTEMEYRTGEFIFVHAGLVPPGFTWPERTEPRLWIRWDFLKSDADFGGTVIVGHTPTEDEKPLVMANKVDIDTGAGYGGPVTAILLDTTKPYDMANLQFVSSL